MLFHYASTAGPHRGAAPPAAPLRGRSGGAQGGHAAGAGAGDLAAPGRSGGKMRGNIAKSREKLIKLGDFACFFHGFLMISPCKCGILPYFYSKHMSFSRTQTGIKMMTQFNLGELRM